MKVVTAEQMRRIDRVTIEERGIPGAQLMEHAGGAVARQILERYREGKVAVVAGKGNNAGDGFVVARLLAERGWPVTVLLLADPDELRGDALAMFRAMPENVNQVRINDAEQLKEALASCDLIVDAILGTGIQGAVRGLFGEAVEAINSARKVVVAVDIPSGLPASGEPIEGPVVRADLTVTMGLPKLGMVIHPGVEFAGKTAVARLDFPDDLINDPAITMELVEDRAIGRRLPERPPAGHKGTFGSALIVGGSPGMTGAPVLASRAAMRSGVGLVFCAIAEALQPQVAARLLEELTIGLSSADGRNLDPSSLESLSGQLARMKAVAVGPGLGRAEQTQQFVRRAVVEIERPMVIDADGLNALGGHMDHLRERKASTILTPHPGEMSRLTGLPVYKIQSDRIGVARRLAHDFGVIVVLKGARTVVAEPGGCTFINPTGNTGLAKGGSGDVLTGLIVGLLAQTGDALGAALCGVFLHGLAADIAARSMPERAIVASDVIDHLPEAMREVEEAAETGCEHPDDPTSVVPLP